MRPQPAHAIRELMAQSDVLVLPSRHEPYGLVVPEAYLQGCAAIVADTGCLPEVGGAGALVTAARDPDSIAAAMRKYIDDRDLLSSKRAAGFELASSRNTIDAWRGAFVDLVDSL